MPLGITPSAGPWQIREFDTASAATYLAGSLVAFNGARNVVEYTSVMSSYLGVALNDSVNSQPRGKVQVAIPVPGCTCWSDITTGVVASALSAGQALGASKPGNLFSFATTLATSVFSKIWASTGRYDLGTTSGKSRVEMVFISNEATIWSTSSVSIG